MSDVSETKAIFEVGKSIEQSQEAFEREQKDLFAMKNAFAMSVKCLEDYRATMLREMQAAHLPIKETEYGKTYVTRCIEIIANLCIETEKKLLRAEGGALAMEQAVKTIKEIYDREKLKNSLLEKALSSDADKEYQKIVEETKPILDALEASKTIPRHIPPIVRPRGGSSRKKNYLK